MLYTTLHYTLLQYNALHHTTLRCAALHCTILYYTALYCIVLYCTVLYYTALYCITLHCTVLYYTALHCTVVRRFIGITFTKPSHFKQKYVFQLSNLCSNTVEVIRSIKLLQNNYVFAW